MDKIAAHRDEVKRMLRAQLAALQAIQTDRDAVVRIMADRFAVEPDIARCHLEQIHTSWSRDGSISREGVETLAAARREAARSTPSRRSSNWRMSRCSQRSNGSRGASRGGGGRPHPQGI